MSRITYKEFTRDVNMLLGGTASGKGYSEGADAPQEIYDFIIENLRTSPYQHALGEIIYKTVRFARKGNIEDIKKVAAWAFLVAKHCSMVAEGTSFDAPHKRTGQPLKKPVCNGHR